MAHYSEQYDKSAVYRELKKMLEAGRLHEVAGIYTLRAAYTSKKSE